MENQEILILKRLKIEKKIQHKKIDKNERKGGKQKSHCQNK